MKPEKLYIYEFEGPIDSDRLMGGVDYLGCLKTRIYKITLPLKRKFGISSWIRLTAPGDEQRTSVYGT